MYKPLYRIAIALLACATRCRSFPTVNRLYLRWRFDSLSHVTARDKLLRLKEDSKKVLSPSSHGLCIPPKSTCPALNLIMCWLISQNRNLGLPLFTRALDHSNVCCHNHLDPTQLAFQPQLEPPIHLISQMWASGRQPPLLPQSPGGLILQMWAQAATMTTTALDLANVTPQAADFIPWESATACRKLPHHHQP